MYKQTGNSSSKRTSPQRKGNKSVTFTNEKPSQLDGQNDDIELRSKRRDRDNTSQVDGIIDDVDDMDERRPPYHRHDDGKSQEALLVKSNGAALTAEDDRGRRRMSASPKNSPDSSPEDDDFNERFGGNLRPTYSRTSTMRSRSPNRAQAVLKETKRKYTYAAFFLVLSLISFVVQTETAVYIQHELGWDKAYCMLYMTHGSWILLYPFLLLILRLQSLSIPWPAFWRRHKTLLKSLAHTVEYQAVLPFSSTYSASPYLFRTVALVTCSLTVAGGSWYVAVNLTSPSDLTAIYNCSAFFAYAFSVPLLKEKLRWDKSFAVILAIAGVLMIAYGDKGSKAVPPSDTAAIGAPALGFDSGKATDVNPRPGEEAKDRLLGNLVIGIGSVLYGLYEVLYKRLACPPSHPVTPANHGMIFATLIGSLIGLFTLTVLWIPLPILHWTGLEPFELPTGEAARLLLISVGANVVFSGSFLVLISLTSPVLSSVAALLTIFLVAFTDWMWTGTPLGPAALWGGGIIVVAFGVLSWATWVEMKEEALEEAKEIEEEEESFLGQMHDRV